MKIIEQARLAKEASLRLASTPLEKKKQGIEQGGGTYPAKPGNHPGGKW